MKVKEEVIRSKFEDLLEDLNDSKPNDRSPKDRCWAIVITSLEKAYAYFMMFVFGNPKDKE